ELTRSGDASDSIRVTGITNCGARSAPRRRSRMAVAGDLTSMAAEREPLQQVRSGLAGWQEAHLDFTGRRDARHTADEPQRLGHALAHVYLHGALLTGLRERLGAHPGRPERV